MWRCWFSWICFAAWATLLGAETYKPLPPQGIELDASVQESLLTRAEQLRGELDQAKQDAADASEWQADVEVLIRAVDLALEQSLFYKKTQVAEAGALLDEAQRRLNAVAAGERGLRLLGLQDHLVDQPQLLVGGFVSTIDDSVQPFGLVIPANFDASASAPWRMDVWLHGRGDTKTEVPFLVERMTKVGQYSPPQTVVLHPFGRHCNAFKFAGERDVYEAIAEVATRITIDHDRIAIRGFSMGGAGCWHLAVHDPTHWFAANPGAGFVDTLVYQGWGNQPPFALTPNRRKLLNWYDVLPYVTNLRNTKTIAYSGELDKQKQAADRVLEASRQVGDDWHYVIGQGMEHKIDAHSAAQIDAKLAQWAAEEIKQPRSEIDFVTYTLRYHRADWLSVTGLAEHWTPGRVRAQIRPDQTIHIQSEGVTHLELDFRRSGWPGDRSKLTLVIDDDVLSLVDQQPEEGLQCRLVRDQGWRIMTEEDSSLRKRPGLQGPIDDAFCDRFLFVVPSRPAVHGVVQRWIDRELEYAQDRWRRLMRGNVRVVTDLELTAADIATNHLICFGDFSSNRFLASIADQLPFAWTRDELRVGEQVFDPSTHAAVFCFPNPLSPQRYVVANSGMTFREFSNVSNSRQIAMLPDWAVFDVSDRVEDGILAGKLVADGFFDEQWRLPASP